MGSIAELMQHELVRRGDIWLAGESGRGSKDRFNPGSPGVGSFGAGTFQSTPFGLEAIDSLLPEQGLPHGAIHEWRLVEHPPEFVPCALLGLLARNNIKRSLAQSFRGDHAPQFQEQGFQKYLLWIGRAAWPTPFLLKQLMEFKLPDASTISFLSRCLFLDPPTAKLKLWAIEAALASPAVATVIVHGEELYQKRSIAKRFALAAKRSGTLGLFSFGAKDLRSKLANAALANAALANSMLTHWTVKPLPSRSLSPSWELALLRYRGRALQQSWCVEIATNEFCYNLENLLKDADAEPISLRLPTAVVNRTHTVERTETAAIAG